MIFFFVWKFQDTTEFSWFVFLFALQWYVFGVCWKRQRWLLGNLVHGRCLRLLNLVLCGWRCWAGKLIFGYTRYKKQCAVALIYIYNHRYIIICVYLFVSLDSLLWNGALSIELEDFHMHSFVYGWVYFWCDFDNNYLFRFWYMYSCKSLLM